ncbi:MAG: hypothetical protein ACYDAN_02475 [Candidatus Limnocylindrales bacterium]
MAHFCEYSRCPLCRPAAGRLEEAVDEAPPDAASLRRLVEARVAAAVARLQQETLERELAARIGRAVEEALRDLDDGRR